MVTSVAGAFVVAMGWQFQATAALRAELDREKIAAQADAAARAEHARLRTLQLPSGELERLAAEVAALPQARAELAALREQTQRAMRDVAEKNSAPKERFAVGETVQAADWRNAGTASPQTALETALWAGAGGDVETFAKTMKFINGQARQAALALLERLPEAMRASHNSPEELIAFLTVRDVPLGSVKVRQISPLAGWPSPAAQMQVTLRAADGKARDTNLLFMNPGDGWKLLVTDGVVAKYAAMLKQTEPVAGGK